MVTPSICGGFLGDKRAMMAFSWSLTTFCTLLAFLMSLIVFMQTNSTYNRRSRYYDNDDWYSSYLQYDYDQQDDGEEEEERHYSQDIARYQEQAQYQILLGSLSAPCLAFAGVYILFLALVLSLYGSTAIVGFMSLRGVYIAPCFSSDQDRLAIGIFGGAIVMFANLLLVNAVILGEVKVLDYFDEDRDRDQQQHQNDSFGAGDDPKPYQVEKNATILAVTCMFLSALYTIFAVLLFLCYAGTDVTEEAKKETELASVPTHRHVTTPSGLVTMDGSHLMDSHGNPGFITMEDSS